MTPQTLEPMSESEILDLALNPINQLLTLGYDDHKGDQRVRSLGIPSNVRTEDLVIFARAIEAYLNSQMNHEKVHINQMDG